MVFKLVNLTKRADRLTDWRRARFALRHVRTAARTVCIKSTRQSYPCVCKKLFSCLFLYTSSIRFCDVSKCVFVLN